LIPYIPLPTVLVRRKSSGIHSAPTPFYRILVMTLYAAGARCAEVARLQVGDIDSQRMVVHIRGGKNREDREVMGSAASCSKPYARTGADSSPRCGFSPAALGILPPSPSSR
jgi:hypothetical protein